MKTISELNNKSWYRFVKILFIGSIFISFLIAEYTVIKEYTPRKIDDYEIQCVGDFTNGKTFYAKEEGIFVDAPYLGSENISLPDFSKKKIYEKCEVFDEEVANSIGESYSTESFTMREGLMEKYGVTSAMESAMGKTYQISPTTRGAGGYLSVIGYSLLVILFTLLIEEVLRRSFYYIILGTVKPKK
jgi:hypothetical protein